MKRRSLVLDANILIRAVLGQRDAIRRTGRSLQPPWLSAPRSERRTDFFGCGVATWTSGSIAIFLSQ